MIYHGINLDQNLIRDFCARYGIIRFSLFGSVLRPDFSAASDIDVLVEFPAGKTPSLLDLGGMQVELTDMLGREVDLKTPGFLSRRIREHVISNAQVQYAA